ncbi:MAG: glutaminyl-peptide cyclotransferase [Candidatus Kapabacteria bacterium]|nr:glutaminyl-peptide cyclotransferase [Candidatus Kapabacteria bacterium]
MDSIKISENNSTVVKNTEEKSSIERFSINIINKFPHDENAFTQGLFYYKGYLFESTGQKGFSSLRKVEIETGKILKKIDLDPEIFAEGAALVGNKIFQISWLNKKCFVYDLNSFNLIKTFEYQGEGWGLTYTGNELVMSDGTNMLRFLDPNNFQTTRLLAVTDDNFNPVHYLNELEFIDGEIWANVWQSDNIVKIDTSTGKIKGIIDCSILRTQIKYNTKTDVLNGIAYDSENKRIFLTGKNWNLLFQVELK